MASHPDQGFAIPELKFLSIRQIISPQPAAIHQKAKRPDKY
jgi:hypothetical protein